jgi:hypothetical protein
MASLDPPGSTHFRFHYDGVNHFTVTGTGLDSVRTVTLTGTIHGHTTTITWDENGKEAGSSATLLRLKGKPEHPHRKGEKGLLDADSGDVTVALDDGTVYQTYPCDYSA